MMIKKHTILFFVFMISLVLIVCLFFNHHYEIKELFGFPITLLNAPLSKYTLWYPNYGVILWVVKLLLILTVIIAFIWMLIRYKNTKLFDILWLKVVVFLSYFILALFLEGNHPFSMIKMYSYLNDEVSVFYIDNCNGEIIPLEKITSKDGARLSHLYYNFEADKRIKKDEIGALIWQQLDIEDIDTCLCLNKSKITSSNHFTKKPVVLYEACN